MHNRGAQSKGQAKGGRGSAVQGGGLEGGPRLSRGTPGQARRTAAEGQGEATQACTGLGARGEGAARGHTPGRVSSKAQGTQPVGGGQWCSEEQSPGPEARGRGRPGPGELQWEAGEEGAGEGAAGAV